MGVIALFSVTLTCETCGTSVAVSTANPGAGIPGSRIGEVVDWLNQPIGWQVRATNGTYRFKFIDGRAVAEPYGGLQAFCPAHVRQDAEVVK